MVEVTIESVKPRILISVWNDSFWNRGMERIRLSIPDSRVLRDQLDACLNALELETHPSNTEKP